MTDEQLVDRLLLERSWRCEKGYPDLGNEKDLNILKETFGITLEQKKEYNYLDSESRQLADKLLNILDLDKTSIEPSSKKNFTIRAPKEIARKELVDKIYTHAEKLGLEFRGGGMGSSIGGFIHKELGIKVIFKDEVTKRMGAAGKGNEQIFLDQIDRYASESSPIEVNIIPVKGSRILKYENIVSAEAVPKKFEIAGYKADAKLKDSQGKIYGVSIKQDGPFRWSSIMGTHKNLLEKILLKAQKGDIPELELRQSERNPNVLNMVNPNNDKNYGRVYILNVPDVSIEKMAFGEDGADVVQRTFSENDFNLRNGMLQISSSKNYETKEDFTEEDTPIVRLEKNASKARKSDGVLSRGITIRTVPAYLMKNTDKTNNLTLDYTELVKNKVAELIKKVDNNL